MSSFYWLKSSATAAGNVRRLQLSRRNSPELDKSRASRPIAQQDGGSLDRFLYGSMHMFSKVVDQLCELFQKVLLHVAWVGKMHDEMCVMLLRIRRKQQNLEIALVECLRGDCLLLILALLKTDVAKDASGLWDGVFLARNRQASERPSCWL